MTTPCLYLQFEVQKTALFRTMVDNFKTDLSKTLQVVMLQKTLAPNHSIHSCSDCLLSTIQVPEPLSQQLGFSTTTVHSLVKECLQLKSAMEDLVQTMSRQMDPNTIVSSLSSNDYSRALEMQHISSNGRNDNQKLDSPSHQDSSLSPELVVKHEYSQESTDQEISKAADELIKINEYIRKVDSMQYKGFKPKSEQKKLKRTSSKNLTQVILLFSSHKLNLFPLSEKRIED